MSTLTEIEAAADSLPPEEKQELLRFLAERLRAQRHKPLSLPLLGRSKRGFPISKGRIPFASEDVARIELESELYR